MSPQLTIITAAMSLGGMASVGFNHYGHVEKQVAEQHLIVEEEKEQLEVAQVGEEMNQQVKETLAELKESFQLERDKDRAGFASMLKDVAAEVEVLREQQGTHEILMNLLSQEQDSLGFKVEAFSEKFRPLRATGSRFQPVRSDASQAHPLLPPVESSWTENY